MSEQPHAGKRKRLHETSQYNESVCALEEARVAHEKTVSVHNSAIVLYNAVYEWHKAKQMGVGNETASSLFYDPTQAWDRGVEELWVPEVLEKTRAGRALLRFISPDEVHQGPNRDDLEEIGGAHLVGFSHWTMQLFLSGVSKTPAICTAWKSAEKALMDLDLNEGPVNEIADEFRKFFDVFDKHPFVEYMEYAECGAWAAFKISKRPKNDYLRLTQVFLEKRKRELERTTNAINHFNRLVEMVGEWRKKNDINPDDELEGDLSYWPTQASLRNAHDWLQSTGVGRALIHLVPEYQLPNVEIDESLGCGHVRLLATFLSAFPAKEEYTQAIAETESTTSKLEYYKKLGLLFELLDKDPVVGALHQL